MGFMKTIIKSAVQSTFGFVVDTIGGLGSEYNQRQYFQHAGFISILDDDAQVVMLKEGNNIMGVASADNKDKIPVISAKRDVAIYAGKDKFVMVLANGDIKITGTGTIEIEGSGLPDSIKIGGGSLANLVKDSIINAYNTHTHVAPSGTTGVPTPLFNPVTDATTELEAS